ncbi:MFS transporter [Gandjariella thermophila]|uniref:MFS transporter n=1 Tax=Gandjariella thermophila TaxID=1931992 RepID=A0A4D4JG70_9PSEU|nr:MFS transporter [Gandjariella thermophila]GDY32873.1 MFS transporter [Gandjariella thermophila]
MHGATEIGEAGSRAAAGGRLPGEVWVLVATAFVVAVGFGVVAPALPVFAASFNVGVTAASMVVSAFAFVRLAFAPVSGRLVSLVGERPILVAGILIVALGTGSCAFAGAYWQLLVLRSLAGTGSTMFTVSALGLLVRLSPPHQRGRANGLWATGFLVGNVAGPILGGGLVHVSLRLPFLAYAASLIVAALVAWVFLRNSTPAARESGEQRTTLGVRQALRHPAYRAALASNFANGWAVFGVRISLVPLFVAESLHRDQGLAGVAMSVFAGGNVLALLVAGRLADGLGRKPMACTGLAVAAAGTIWLGFTHGVPAFLAASAVAGVGAGLLNPAQSAAVADVLGTRARGGGVLACFQMLADVGSIVGPLVAGLAVDTLSYPAAFAVTGAMAVLALLTWLAAPETLPAPSRSGRRREYRSPTGG